ncbi:MAG TPA: cytochrome c3 family protein, partial [Bacillota bacterium]|nr:cytochrome c3 family protein [Bacillota bacterium]
MKKILVAVSLAAMLTLGSTAALAVPAGSGTAPSYNSTEMQDNLVTTDAANDNGLFNANGTGIGVGTNDGSTLDTVIKAAYNGAVKSKTHTAYQKNTNACAACHQTHTGAAKNLLFKDGVYNTCTACHDGTLGFYNVFTPSAAGTFGGTSGGNMSVHLANDTVLVKAAPGGNAAGTDEKSWGASFDCASCHAPHGSYSPRLLNWNPNDMGDVSPAEGGIAAVTDTIYGVADLTNPAVIAAGAPYIAVRGTANDLGITAGSSSVAIKVYELNPDKTAYVAATNPWIYEYTYDHTHTFKAYVTNFFKNGVTDYTAVQAAADAGYKKGNATYDAAQANIINADDTGLKWYYGAGYVISTSAAGDTLLNSAQTADVARAYVVKLDMQNTTIFGGHQLQTSNDKSLWAGGAFAGYGVTVSKYCAACHTDYMASSGSAT